jgi:hypothetical protein
MQYIGTLPVLFSGSKRPLSVLEGSHFSSLMRDDEVSLNLNRLFYC